MDNPCSPEHLPAIPPMRYKCLPLNSLILQHRYLVRPASPGQPFSTIRRFFPFFPLSATVQTCTWNITTDHLIRAIPVSCAFELGALYLQLIIEPFVTEDREPATINCQENRVGQTSEEEHSSGAWSKRHCIGIPQWMATYQVLKNRGCIWQTRGNLGLKSRWKYVKL